VRGRLSARFVLALAEYGEREGEQEDQQKDQDPKRHALPQLVSSLDYDRRAILTQSTRPVLRNAFVFAAA
jgi:hypothetical protein